jgi:hypothetical protein
VGRFGNGGRWDDDPFGCVLNNILNNPVPGGVLVCRLDRLKKSDLRTRNRCQRGGSVRMDEETKNGVDLFPADEPDQAEESGDIHSAAGDQGRDGNSALSQLIRDRSPTVKARDVNVHLIFPREAKRQFPNHRWGPANLQVSNEEQYSPRHRDGSLPEPDVMPNADCQMPNERWECRAFTFGTWQLAIGISLHLHSIHDFVVVTPAMSGDSRA